MEIAQGNSPAYRKMHVVGPRQAIALDEVSTQQREAKAMRDYNPKVNAMVEAQSNIRDILEKATSDTPSKSRKRKAGGGKAKVGASTSLSLYNACIERLHALKSQFDSSYEPLLQLMMDNNVTQAPVAVGAAAAPVPPAAPAGPAVVAAPGGLPQAAAAALPAVAQVAMMGTPLRPATIPPPVGTPTQWMDLPESLGSLPKIYHERYKDLRGYLTKDPYAFKLAPKGQVVFKGNVVPGSSFNDLVRGLYVSARGKKPTPEGMTEFLEALSTVGVPSTLLSAVAVRSQYAGIQAASRMDKASTSAPSSEKKKVKEQIADQKVQVHFLPPKVQTGKRSSSLPKSGAQQTGKGITDCFPGKPVKCLRLY
jgi:hypothetical protein